MTLSRRNVLSWMGIQLALPVALRALPATAQAIVPRRRFIGVFFPNGAYMPGGADGNWNFAEALQPIAAAGFQSSTVVVRGLHQSFPGVDPHWQNCAGFLSCQPILLGVPGVVRCGKSVDQYVADRNPTPLRSLEVGAPYYHVHPLTDHPGYSDDYLNRISWQADDKARAPIPDPKAMFEKLFARSQAGAVQLRYQHARQKSILDHLSKDASRVNARLPVEQRPVLESYLETVRDVERELTAQTPSSCMPGMGSPTESFADRETNYLRRYQLMHQMVVIALQCGLTNAATFMYGPSSSFLGFTESLGMGTNHHGCAHNKGEAPLVARVRQITRLEMGLVADLLTRLNAANLLEDTLVLCGSDMSDGDAHNTTNLPTLLCGKGPGIRWGTDVQTGGKPLSDLHLELLQLLGVSGVSSFGSGAVASTGQPTGVRV